jgi:hypothetical protein
MAGLLGAVLAGGAKGYADQRIKSIEQQEAFDMKQALLDAEMEKQLRLKEAGIKMEEEADQRRRGDIAKTIEEADAADPNAGKGGYETDEMKAESERKRLERRRDSLGAKGYLEESDRYDQQLARRDASDAKQAGLVLREQQLKQQQEIAAMKNANDVERTKIYGEKTVAQIEAANARLATTAANAELKRAQGKKLTAEEIKAAKFIEAYGSNPEYVKDGKLQPAGYDKLYGKEIDDRETLTSKVQKDDEGNVISQEEVTTKKQSSKPGAKTQPVKKYVPGKGFV